MPLKNADKPITQAERDAVMGREQDVGTRIDTSDKTVLSLEESAFLYVNIGGTDPRALQLVKAAKDAGRDWDNPESDEDELVEDESIDKLMAELLGGDGK